MINAFIVSLNKELILNCLKQVTVIPILLPARKKKA